MRTVIGAALLDLGLLAMLCSFFLFVGLGLTGGLIAAVAAPLMIIGILLDHTWPRMAPFAVGMAMGCGWLYMALSW